MPAARRSSRRNSGAAVVDTLAPTDVNENAILNTGEMELKTLDDATKAISSSNDVVDDSDGDGDGVTHTQVSDASPADETDTSVEENDKGSEDSSNDGDNVDPVSTDMESNNAEIMLNPHPPSPIPVSQTQNEEEDSDEGGNGNGDHHDTSSTSDENDRSNNEKCENATNNSPATTSDSTASSSLESGVGEDEEDDEEGEEQWDLVHVFTAEELKCNDQEKVQSCMTKNCPLLACVTYRSSLDADNKDLWHSCIDCQEKDFGGWPEELKEIPITFMSQEHKDMIVEMCTAQYSPEMPKLPEIEGGGSSIPSFSSSQQDDPVTTNLENKSGDEKALENNTSSVTPPRPHCAQSKTENESVRKEKKTSSSKSRTSASTSTVPKVSPMPVPQKKKPSAIPKCYQKWQEESDKKGGGKIIVKKADAKPIIFDMLKDAFRPMNITQIYNVSTVM